MVFCFKPRTGNVKGKFENVMEEMTEHSPKQTPGQRDMECRKGGKTDFMRGAEHGRRYPIQPTGSD
jgi:hypothetical protein